MREFWNDVNLEHDFFCYGKEGQENLWSIWRESTDEQITPWLDLGPEGGILFVDELADGAILFKISAKAAEDGEERVGLFRWPEGTCTGATFQDVARLEGAGLFALQDSKEFSHISFADWLGGYGLVNEKLEWVLPCTLPGNWSNRPELVSTGLLVIYDSLDPEPNAWKLEWRRGLFSLDTFTQLQPCQYTYHFVLNDRVFAVLEPAGMQSVTDVFDLDGNKIASFNYRLQAFSSEQLLVEQSGLWGWADATGVITVAPYAKDQCALQAEAVEPTDLTHLALARGCETSALLEDDALNFFISQLQDGYFGVKYEPDGDYLPSDGYCDIQIAVLSQEGLCFWIEDRFASDTFQLVVLTEEWRKLARGTLLRIEANKRLVAVEDDGEEMRYVEGILAQTMLSIEFDFSM